LESGAAKAGRIAGGKSGVKRKRTAPVMIAALV
jgi:hypothetical protein